MKQEELDIILDNHGKWFRNEGGVRADLRYTELKNTNLRYASLSGADLSNANLSNVNLNNANLSYADLSGANLRHADLKGANLANANLRHTDLSSANLRHADLRGANLANANLRHADLRGLNLNWVNWQHVEGLTVICVQVDTTRKNNQITYIKELEIWIKDGFQGTLDELKASVEQTHKDNEKLRKRYYRVIDFILNEVAE
ncbi:pentapeptide repeat-containing protein [Listeria welshimeri]|uniref:pentapeptide repeat-containing protein n=1 Tax=Listeria welshimeri TaxID=1643 RepID=UPI001886DAFB|nr:pentapeptide repeat-containing protein [Listeria welshimeri]MBF2342560.1 pentapeptide repeat-containing protein [Listeria welshimeri]